MLATVSHALADGHRPESVSEPAGSERANHSKGWGAKLKGLPRHPAERQPVAEDQGNRMTRMKTDQRCQKSKRVGFFVSGIGTGLRCCASPYSSRPSKSTVEE